MTRSRTTSIAALAALTATVLAVAAAPGGASTAKGSRTVVVMPGDSVRFAKLDLACAIAPSDWDGVERGPAMYCNRYGVNVSRAFGASNDHFWIYNATGHRIVYKVSRRP